MCEFLCRRVFILCGYMRRCGIAGSLDNSVTFGRTARLFSKETALNSHQVCMRARFFVHLLTLVIVKAILVGMTSHCGFVLHFPDG